MTAFKSSTTNQTFDADGNQLTSSTGYTYTYNAWDEMLSSSITGSGTTEYTYNALGQRITIGSGVGSGSTMQYQYYSAAGQVIETDEVFDGTGSAISQYVWGLAYQNDLLVRDDNSSDGCYGAGYSSLGRRIFAIEDANFDVTGLASTSAIVQQRFEYTPYGVRTALTASYVGTTDGYSFEVGFQGGIVDPDTGLIRFGVRDYDPVTGRWTEPEPFGSAYVDGPNLEQAFDSNPVTESDPSGFAPDDDDAVQMALDAAVREKRHIQQNEFGFEPDAGPSGLLGKNEWPFDLPNGDGGSVRVDQGTLTNLNGERRQGVIRIMLTSSGKTCPCRIIQFVNAQGWDANNYEIGAAIDNGGDVGYIGRGWTTDGRVVAAMLEGKSDQRFSFYGGYSNFNSGKEVSIADWPNLLVPPSRTNFRKIKFSFLDIVVCPDDRNKWKPTYQLYWTSTLTANFKGDWDRKYQVGFEGNMMPLPKFAQGDALPSDWTNSKGAPLLPNGFVNPIDTAYR